MIVATKSTVFIIEPDEAQRQVITLALEHKYPVVAVAAGDILECIQQYHPSVQQPHVILLESGKMGESTKRLIQHLRVAYNAKEVIIICLSSYNEIHYRVDAYNAGANDFVIKPIDEKTFAYRVKLQERNALVAQAV